MPARANEIQTLYAGLAMGESPRWHDNRLWLSDWGAQEVVAIDRDGKGEVVARVASFPFCIDFTPGGRLLAVSSSQQQLLRAGPDGLLVPWVDLSGISRKPWNEIVVDGRGNAYLNNIGFDFPGGEFAPGCIALVTPDGAIREVANDVAFPNGMAVTPDNSTLIVAESYGQKLTAFDIGADGGLSNRRIWAQLDGYPDGICLDGEGAIWFAEVPQKRCVRVREGGEILQTVEFDRGCFACMLGGEDGHTLYVVANEWGGADNMSGPQRTGRVFTIRAPAPRAGKP